MLAQNNDEGKENALYYVSRTMVGVEINYSFMENIWLVIVFATQKLWYYLLSRQIILISKALKYTLSKPVLLGRLAKWAILLSPFNIKFILQKTVKGQAIVDFITAHLCSDNKKLPDDLPDDEVMPTEIKT